MSKQTAVEFLIEKLNQCEPMYSGIQSNEHKEYIDILIEKAKEMEKDQIINAHGDEQSYLQDDGSWKKVYAEQYYNETYKKEEK
jgi:hypothetical protein